MRYLPLIKRNSLFRELFLGVAISVFVFVCALAWGGPFLLRASSGAAVHAQLNTFTGTVVRTGEQFELRATSGQVYRLDDPQHAQSFEGKAVTVTGTLDAQADLIHVEQIQSAAA